MAYSIFRHTGTGSPQTLAVPPYLDKSHIKVFVAGAETTAFTWLTTQTISLTATFGTAVSIQRRTSPEQRIVDYLSGVTLTEGDLDQDSLQAFYMGQEAIDVYNDLVGLAAGPLDTAIAAAAAANVSAGLAATSAASAAAALGNLPNYVSATYGAGQVGFGPGLSYGANTLGAFLRKFNRIEKYGTLANDGVTDDSAVFNAAVASGDRFIDARGVNCRLSSTWNLGSNQTWLLDGAVFNITSSSLTAISAVTKTGFRLVGPWKLTGGGSGVGSAIGLYIVDCSKWRIASPTIGLIQGFGIKCEPGTSGTTRSDHGVIENPRIYDCYYGYEDTAGTGGEYTTLLNPHITGCTAHGLKSCAGNTLILGGHIVDNVGKGVHLSTGANHGHGMFIGTNINHNGTFGIHAETVLNGFTFDGCHIYENAVWFDRSKGVHITGGVLDASLYNYKDGSSGLNYIDGCYCPGDYGINRLIGSNDGHDQLIVTNLRGTGVYAKTGGKDTAGVSIVDPALCYVLAQRDAASTQSLTSGVAATMTWSTGGYYQDRRSAANFGTGSFTIPQAGLFRIDIDALFGGTAMNALASFVEVKVNGSSKKLFIPSIYSTTKLQAQGSFELYLNASDVVTFVATITGTTPVFGDGAYVSNASIRRIA